MAQAPDIRRYLKHGTLPQLRAFAAAARLGSLTRAAEELHLAQATISVQIKKLSETVGLPLFEQVGSRLQLTEAGERVYQGCEELFRALSGMEQDLESLRSVAAGPFALAVPPSARHFAARLLEAFVQRNPGIQPSLQVHERAELIERLGIHADDLYLFVEPPGERQVVAQALVANPLVVLASPEHPLAAQSDVPFARLAEESLILREPGSGIRMITLRLFARHNLAPKIRLELGSDEAIREAILAGLGVGILPRYAPGLDPALGRLVCLDVEGFPLESHWHFVYPLGARLSPAARAFMDFSRAEAKALFRDCLREKGTLLATNPAMKGALLVACMAVAASAANAALSDFEAIDADGDGRISAAEHAAGAKKMFQAMDSNRDGRVTAGEMSAAQKAVSGVQAMNRRMSSAEKIKAVDANGDGILTEAEHETASRSIFDKMDANRDGYLTRDEWSAGHAALAKK